MRYSKAIATALIACSIVSLPGCLTVDEIFGEEDPQVSNVELMAMQTREFEATVDQAFQAVIATFQDYGYIISSADKSTGLVIAKTTSQGSAHWARGYVRTEYDKATASIEQISKTQVKIRISIVKYVAGSSTYGAQTEKEAPRTNPKTYQDMFAKIQQSLFLKKNL